MPENHFLRHLEFVRCHPEFVLCHPELVLRHPELVSGPLASARLLCQTQEVPKYFGMTWSTNKISFFVI